MRGRDGPTVVGNCDTDSGRAVRRHPSAADLRIRCIRRRDACRTQQPARPVRSSPMLRPQDTHSYSRHGSRSDSRRKPGNRSKTAQPGTGSRGTLESWIGPHKNQTRSEEEEEEGQRLFETARQRLCRYPYPVSRGFACPKWAIRTVVKIYRSGHQGQEIDVESREAAVFSALHEDAGRAGRYDR